jgi:hypothetical protein
MTTYQNLDEYEMVNGKWVKKSTSDSRPLPDINDPIPIRSDSTPDLGDSTSDLGMDIDSMDLGGSTPILGGSTPDLGGGGLADALSGSTTGQMEKFKEVFTGGAPVKGVYEKKAFTGLAGDATQQDINQKIVEAREDFDPTLFKETYAGQGKSFDAAAARQMFAEAGAVQSGMRGAGSMTRFGHSMQDLLEKNKGWGAMSDEVRGLEAWLVNRGQSNRDLQFGLQNINAQLYASQLATQMALSGIPLDMIKNILGGLGGLGGGGLLGGIMDPVTQALQG